MSKFPQNITLKTHQNQEFELSRFCELNDCVLIFYPKMGQSGKALEEEYKNTNGLVGCTPQGKAYECLKDEFELLGFSLIGIGTHGADEQAKFKSEIEASYLFLNDENFMLEEALGLKSFYTPDGKKFYFRQTFVIKNGEIISQKIVTDVANDAQTTLEFIKNLNR
ncbi:MULTISPECIES: redoxin domain-containing protein [Campylobacter]|uniref:redoxin domain-containing protein n=1 Tax=Campylobacter TaxID=194 RepID=UPI001472D997|nr:MULTISPECIES: redoxin domain-containing protein [unclassified Campylobacter]MBE3021974.1 redoxin domain-containing protein [Campylobacter sp. 7477a]MBE3609709.1 redoxin domain-containing protein [Campylobacter sp. RM12916]